jgi:hypothetical protein
LVFLINAFKGNIACPSILDAFSLHIRCRFVNIFLFLCFFTLLLIFFTLCLPVIGYLDVVNHDNKLTELLLLGMHWS